MAIIINGKELAQKIRLGLKDEVENLKTKGINPKLAVIMVGNERRGNTKKSTSKISSNISGKWWVIQNICCKQK